MSWLGGVHLGAAVAALLVGLAMLLAPKGTDKHRRFGRLYLACLILLNAAALLIYEDSAGKFSVFHYLALLSLATLALGFGFIRFGRQAPRRIITHAHFMAWSFAGLAAAGAGQAAAMLGVSVAFVIAAVLSLAAVIIHTRIRTTFARYLETRNLAH